MKKSQLYIGLSILFVIVWLYSLFTPVITQAQGYVYYLRPGTSKRAMILELTQQNIIKHPFLFSLFAYPQRNVQLKTGEYLFPKGSSLYSIWKQMTTGSGFYNHPFVIIPGWSFTQLRRELANAQGLRHLTAKLSDQQTMERLGYPHLGPEGEFFPETYYYIKGIPDLVILKRAIDLMQNRLQELWQHRASGLPYKSEYEALIAASLIEKEAYLNSERPIISGVLINRLKKNMLLQFDPTIIYGLGERYDGKIHKENLQEDNPYNTYLHRGLPPTPIAMPSIESIKAAMHPQVNDYFYFVAKGDGSHQFSKTLIEHNMAVDSAFKWHNPNFNEAIIRRHMENYLGQKLN